MRDIYPTGDVERFALSRNRVHGGEIRGEVSLQLGSKVRMTLTDYCAIGCEMDRLRQKVAELVDVVDEVRKAVG